MKWTIILKSNNQYRYHATTNNAIDSIIKDGLIPNEGQYGNGVYFAKTEQDALNWTSQTTQGNRLLRVKLNDLKIFDYDEFSDQGWTTQSIPSEYIEIKGLNNKWYKITDLLKGIKY